eukprot:6201918-Pleurochrysis_carterae.AAC.4
MSKLQETDDILSVYLYVHKHTRANELISYHSDLATVALVAHATPGRPCRSPSRSISSPSPLPSPTTAASKTRTACLYAGSLSLQHLSRGARLIRARLTALLRISYCKVFPSSDDSNFNLELVPPLAVPVVLSLLERIVWLSN